MRPPACFEDPDAKLLIDRLCKESKIDAMLLTDLVEIVQKYSGSGRREGVFDDVSKVLERFQNRAGA